MKRLTIIILFSACTCFAAFAQAPKFGHVNFEEIVYLMSEMDSARVVLEKYSADLQETFTSMQNEFQTKYSTYQQMNANWTPAVLDAKTKELQSMEQRIQEFQQSASTDLQNKQNELLAPIYQKANTAIQKVGKDNGFIYIFNISPSSATIPYVDENQSINIADLVKKELAIPLDKTLPVQTAMPQ